MFKNFGKSGSQFCRWQRVEKTAVNHRQRRLLKHADVVLKSQKINSELSAYTRIHLGKKGCRNKHKVDTSFISRCAKTTHVTKYTSANNNKQSMAVKRHLSHAIPDPFACAQCFILLTAFNFNEVFGKFLRKEGKAMRPGIFIYKCRNRTVTPVFEETGQGIDRAMSEQYVFWKHDMILKSRKLKTCPDMCRQLSLQRSS